MKKTIWTKLQIPAEYHRKARIKAINAKMTLKAMLLKLIIEGLK